LSVDFAAARASRAQRRIATLLRLDDGHVGTLSPDFELLDGGRAKGIGGAEEDAAALRFVKIGELAGSSLSLWPLPLTPTIRITSGALQG